MGGYGLGLLYTNSTPSELNRSREGRESGQELPFGAYTAEGFLADAEVRRNHGKWYRL